MPQPSHLQPGQSVFKPFYGGTTPYAARTQAHLTVPASIHVYAWHKRLDCFAGIDEKGDERLYIGGVEFASDMPAQFVIEAARDGRCRCARFIRAQLAKKSARNRSTKTAERKSMRKSTILHRQRIW